MGEWTRIPRATDLTGAGPHAVSVPGHDLVLVRTGAGLKAFEGHCPHQGALLGEGELDGETLVCRNHRWRFSVETGQRQGGGECLLPCPVRERAGEVEVDVSALVREGAKRAAPRVAGAERLRRPSDLPGPAVLPFIGTAHLLQPNRLHLQFEEWARTYGTPFRYRFGNHDVVVFSELGAMQRVLRGRPESFRRGKNLERIFRELGVHGVFSAEGSAWRPQRRLSMEALSHLHLRGFYPTLASVAARLRRRWTRAVETGEVLDLAEELKRFTVDVTTQLAFGKNLDTLAESAGDDVIQRKLELLFPTFNRRLFSVIPWWRVVRLPEDRRVDRAVAELRDWLAGLVRETRRRLAEDPALAEHPTNFLEAMLTARDENGEPFDDDVVFGNAMTMLLAGEDTTAYTLAWAVHHLLDAPADVAALRAEVDRALGRAAVPPDIETANGLVYAGAIANETMRVRPVAPLSILNTLTEVEVGGITLPLDTQVVLLMRAPAMRADHFGDPTVFRPARWLDPSATGGAHEPSAHIPFGSGPRICPGRTLALLEMKVVLAMLYRTFEVTRVGAREDVREVLAFTMLPSSLRVRLAHRRVRSAAALESARR